MTFRTTSLFPMVFGSVNNDVLTTGVGSQFLFGFDGDDVLNGGLGSDQLFGGNGADRFVFDTKLGAGNVDAIDFNHAQGDVIALKLTIFGALKPTQTWGIEESAFHIGKAAHDSNDRIVYDQETGALYYDRDGNGAAAAVKFAALQPGTDLHHSDFMIF